MSDVTGDEARSYLLRFLREKDVTLKTASLLVGKSHAYLQQYVRKRKPVWLPEEVRELLAREYGIDSERLKPPTLRAQVHVGGKQNGDIQPPGEHQLIDEPRLVELIRIWSRLPEERRDLALNILRNLTTG